MFHKRSLTPLLLVIAVLAAACGSGAQAVVSTGKPVSATDPNLATYRDVGCAACHGQNGQGDIGPPLGGHTARQVIRQVRAPLGAMPLFTTAEVSDAELESVIEFITGMGPMSMEHPGAPDEGEDEGGLDPREVLIGHHWMTLSAIDAGQAGRAISHIMNITALVQGEHLSAMNDVVALLEAGDLDGARQGTLEMLAGFLPEAGSIDALHLQLASQALAVDATAEATVHLGRVGEGPMAEVAQLAVEALSAGQSDEALELLHDALSEIEVDPAGEGDH